MVGFVSACTGRPESGPPELSDRELIEVVADVLLPGDGELPPASAIGIADRFERYRSIRPAAAQRHSADWPTLRAGFEPVSPDGTAEVVAAWYEELRSSAEPSPDALRFESLRRDLLSVYYAHPRVQDVLGYAGPAVVRGV